MAEIIRVEEPPAGTHSGIWLTPFMQYVEQDDEERGLVAGQDRQVGFHVWHPRPTGGLCCANVYLDSWPNEVNALETLVVCDACGQQGFVSHGTWIPVEQ